MRTPTNFFKVGVCFKDHAYGIEDRGRDGKVVTPVIVLAELTAFCRRVRRDLLKSTVRQDKQLRGGRRK